MRMHVKWYILHPPHLIEVVYYHHYYLMYVDDIKYNSYHYDVYRTRRSMHILNNIIERDSIIVVNKTRCICTYVYHHHNMMILNIQHAA